MSRSRARGTLYLALFASMLAGVFCARYSAAASIAICSSALVLGALTGMRGRRPRSLITAAAFFSLGALLSGLASGSADGLPGTALRAGTVVTVEGRVTSQPVSRGGLAWFLVRTDSLEAGGRLWRVKETLLVTESATGATNEPVFDDVVVVSGRLSRPPVDDWFVENGVSAKLSASPGSIAVTGRDISARGVFERLRAAMSHSYAQAFPPGVCGFIDGVTNSKLDTMSPSQLEEMKDCGILHIVSVSGLHVTAVAMLVLSAGAVAGLGRRARYSVAAVAALFVCGLSGFRPCAVRSMLMATLAFGGAAVGRDHDGLAGLSVAGILILCFDPLAAFDQGFQYSFAATLAIVIAINATERRTGVVRSFLTVCAAAQLGIIPVAILHSQQVPVTAMAANAVAVPLVGPILVMSWLVAAAVPLSLPLARFLALAPGAMSSAILRTSAFLSMIPTAGAAGGTAAMISLALYTGALAGTIRAVRGCRSLLKPMVAFGSALAVALVPLAGLKWAGSPSEMVALDVGQGDAVLFRDRDGGTVLFDAGPPESGVTEALLSYGVGRLDLVVVSHPHADHVGGLPEVLRRLPTGRLLEAGWDGGACSAYRESLGVARERGIPQTIARSGQTITVTRSMSIEVVHAPSGEVPSRLGLNDRSIAAMVTVDGTRVLMPGDLESAGQGEMLSEHPDLACDVLKVAHQGAANGTSQALLDATRPGVAVISVEAENPYGHPSRRCLELLESRGMSVLRTDRDGDVVIGIDGDRISF